MRIALILISFCIVSCSNTRSDEALYVKTIKNSENCESLGIITGRSPAFALSASDERIGAMNSAYNKAAQLGANALLVLNAERTNFGGGVVKGEAFKCETISPENVAPHPSGW